MGVLIPSLKYNAIGAFLQVCDRAMKGADLGNQRTGRQLLTDRGLWPRLDFG